MLLLHSLPALILAMLISTSVKCQPQGSTVALDQPLEINSILTEEINLPGLPSSSSSSSSASVSASNPSWKTAECHRRPVVHVLEHADCIPMPVPSAACVGTCHSYVQVSSSKFWQVERSCSCCAELGQLEATFYLRCPRLVPQFKKVTARSPKDCACRPCTSVDAAAIVPQDMLDLQSN